MYARIASIMQKHRKTVLPALPVIVETPSRELLYPPLPLLLSTFEAAAYLGMTAGWLVSSRSKGRPNYGMGPPFKRVGRQVKYRTRDLVSWSETQGSVKEEVE